jgi:hypothetical protein
MLYLTLSILISFVLQSYILLDFFLFVEVLEDGNYLIYVFSFEFRGHSQIVLEHVSCLGVFGVNLKCTGCLPRLRRMRLLFILDPW